MISTVREYVADKVIPVAGVFEKSREFPGEIIAELARMGLLGMSIPEEWGGLGLDVLTRSRIFRELTYGWMSLAGIVASHSVAGGMIANFGTSEQQARWLPALASGDLLGALSLTEPHTGSDLKNITCRVTQTDSGFSVDGLKTFVSNGSRASVVLLAAKSGQDEISCFIVGNVSDGKRTGTLMVSAPFEKLGARGQDIVEMAYANHPLPADAMLGGEAGRGRGLRAVLTQLDVGRILIANFGVGIGQAAYDAAARYAAGRTAFGQTVDSFEGIQFKLAEMATKLYAARAVADDVAAKHDAGEDVRVEAAMAKYFCSEVGVEVSLDAMRIHGGAGYVADFPVERFYRDAALNVIGEGTNELLKMLIARGLKQRQTGGKAGR